MQDEGFDSSFALDSPQQSKPHSTRNLLLPEPNPITPHQNNSLTQIHDKLLPIQNRHQQQQLIYLKHPLPINPHQLKYHFNGYFLTIKQQYEHNQIQLTNQPSFNSQFQSANLFAVYISQPNQYDLILQDDTNSNGYSQWFHFQIQNIPLLPLTLNFINMSKHYYPLSQSKEFTIYIQYDNSIWQPLQNATILQSSSQYIKQRFYAQSRPLHKMTIEFTPQYPTFKLALTNPYTINDLNIYLKDNAIRETILTHTICGQPIKMLQFGSPSDDVVILIARQHPGETVSSFICQGFLQALLNNSLPNHHVIVIPMINPDGVEQGNFRCDFNGIDLNRSWHRPNKVTQAHLIIIKRFFSSILKSGRNIKCFIDLHGHSKYLNSFIYGCRGTQDPVACRILPTIMSQVSKYFDLKRCTFSLEPCKLKTARAYVYKLVERYSQRRIGNFKCQSPETIQNIFTLETSFFGYVEEGKQKQFKMEDLLQIGHDLLNSLNIYYTDYQAVMQMKNKLERHRQEYVSQDIANNQNKGEEESDSDLEGGQIRQIDLEKTLGKQNKTKQKLKYKITTTESNKNTDTEMLRNQSKFVETLVKDASIVKQIPRKYSVQNSTRREHRYTMQKSFNQTQMIQQPRLCSDSQINGQKVFQTQQSTNYENNCVEINFPIQKQYPPPYRQIKNYCDNSFNECSRSIKVQEQRNQSCNNYCYPQIKRQQINSIWLQDQNKFKDFRDNHLIFSVNHKVMRKNTYQTKKQ